MLNIALLQISSSESNERSNLAKGEYFCRQAKEMGADIALFPEMWNIGYGLEEGTNPHLRAINQNSLYLQHFQKLAQELNMAICCTYLEEKNAALFNSMSLIDRHGKTILHYSKVHTCDFAAEAFLQPGSDFYTSELDTEKGVIKIGAMICFDREFPESARILMLQGAEVILVPNACELEINRIAQIQTRAFENMIGIAVANYPTPKANGHSVAFDGMAYNEAGHSRDMMITQSNENETILFVKFDIEKLRTYRKQEVWGNAYRKPSSYSLLLSKTVNEPFIRKDAK